ncbi:MAG: ABC transporter ATP-binding protein [Erysipelotrichaceae bacterium]
MEYAIEVDNLSIVYPKSEFTLDNISFNVPKGSIMGFVGKNGARKSTTIRAILGMLAIKEGNIEVLGSPATSNVALKQQIGVVFDQLWFNEDLTPSKLNRVFREIYTQWDEAQYYKYLERFALPTHKKIKTYSRGMQMKLGLSVALSHHAKLLILDEATAGLDPVAREEILDMLLEFVSNEEHSVLLSSHISSDLEKVADSITVIDQGCIVSSESKDDLMYCYGIARMKQSDFECVNQSEIVAYRKRGLQIDGLIKDKQSFTQNYPHIIVDTLCIDELLVLLTGGQ